MIDGTPYQRLLAVNGKPLPQATEAQAMKEHSMPRRSAKRNRPTNDVTESRNTRGTALAITT